MPIFQGEPRSGSPIFLGLPFRSANIRTAAFDPSRAVRHTALQM